MSEHKQFLQTTEPMVYHCAWDTPEQVRPGSHYGPVLRDVYTFECNVSGYGTITINGKTFDIKPKAFYFLLPGQTVTFTADRKEPRLALWCTAGGLRLGQLLASAGITDDTPFAPADHFEALYAVMQKLYALGQGSDMGTQLRRTACLYELMAVLTDGRTNSVSDLFVEQAVGVMESGYHTELTVADIAAELGFDRCYFSTLFKSRTGISPHAYLTALRIRKASVLLSASDASVAEIAESVGLDPRNFARLFKKETGKTPGEYKKGR
ncbi:MAG: AraC family transcriptional regulator [Clostridia bacterium]|nr:AraC family transcriptional regulator [Clostridia bacterium]